MSVFRKKIFLGYDLNEAVYQISSLYRFLTHQHIYKKIKENTLRLRHEEFEKWRLLIYELWENNSNKSIRRIVRYLDLTSRNRLWIKKIAICKMKPTSHLIVTWKLMEGVRLWVRNGRLNKRGAIISEGFNNWVKWHQEWINLKEMIII